MADYSFVTSWKFDAPLEKVYAAVHDADNYHLWWNGQSPVQTSRNGNALGIGAIKKFRTRSVLPFYLNYIGTVIEIEPMKKMRGTTTGDLEGEGIWIFETENGVTTATYYWVVKTNSVFMNFLTPVFRPLFEWNHHKVMKWGGEGLAKHLNCRMIQ